MMMLLLLVVMRDDLANATTAPATAATSRVELKGRLVPLDTH